MEIIELEVKDLKVKYGEWLEDVFKRENEKETDKYPLNSIPTNCIFDKTICGLGATHCELEAKRNSIIVEPNVPVIVGKQKGYEKERLGVYDGGASEPTIKNYLLNDNIEYKKILTTPESYIKVRRIAKDNNVNLYDNYFCLCDECEKMTQDIDYRETIDLPMIDFFKYAGKAFVSATPLKIRNPKFKENGFFILKVIPQFDYIKDIDLVVTNRYNYLVTQKLDDLCDSECVCVFLNSTNGINKLVTHLRTNRGIQDTDYKIFCSKKSVIKNKFRAINESFEDLDLPLAKYNFFTSRFFSAVDIKTPIKPDILILTDLWEATHTEIDPFTSAIQLCGRFRTKEAGEKTFNSLTHITNIGYYKEENILSEKDVDVYVSEFQKKYLQLTDELNQATEKGHKQLLKDFKNSKAYKRFVYTDEEKTYSVINYFAIDNFYDDHRVKSYYLTPENLKNAYCETTHFNPLLYVDMDTVGEDSSLYYAKLKTPKECREFIVKNLDVLIKEFGEKSKEVEYAKNQFRREDDYKKENNADYIIKAVEKVGCEALKKTNYTETQINKLLKEHNEIENDKKMFSPKVKKAIEQKFPAGKYLEADLINGIKETFEHNGIDRKVNYPIVQKYFSCDKCKGKDEKGMIKIRQFAPDDEYK